MSDAIRHWIAVASAENVALGRSLGIMQVCHGKAAPLGRITPGDRVIYYSLVAFEAELRKATDRNLQPTSALSPA